MAEAANITVAKRLQDLRRMVKPENAGLADEFVKEAAYALNLVEGVVKQAQYLRQDIEAGEEWDLEGLRKALEDAGFPLYPRS